MRLTNFKSWDDTGLIRLAPFTVFFGRNSSGKSSLLQAPLLMKQTAESLDSRQVLRLRGPEAYADLGTYQDLIRDHDTGLLLGLTFNWHLSEPIILRPGSGEAPETYDLSFTTSIGRKHQNRQLAEMVVQRLAYETSDEQMIGMGRRAGDDGGYELLVGGIGDLQLQVDASYNLPEPFKCYGFPGMTSLAFQGTYVLSELSHRFEELMAGISYVGPLRSRPSRSYQWPGNSPESVGRDGENTVSALLARSGSDFHSMIGRWLRHMGVIDDFNIEAVAAEKDLYDLKVTAPSGTTPVSIIDVGFGVSQVLPVLVQVFYAAQGSSVILEQPEIHLHPAAQSALGDVLLDAVHRHGVQLLVETHSEHLLHRIQRRIAEEALSPEDVALYFVETRDNRSHLRELTIDAYGNITNWPQDFFGDEMGDLAAMTRAAAERHRHP
jgi:predicted ATPase